MYRFGTSTADLAAANAKEIVALKPDLILVSTSPGVAAILRETRSIPTVFTNVADPVGSGFVSSFSRPGGNITGFANFEPSMSGKWLEILKDLAPSVRRVMILFNPETAPNAAYFPSLKVAAPSLSIELLPTPAHDPAEIEAAVSSFAKEPNGGVISFPDITMYTHRKIIIGLMAKYQLPAVYGYRIFVSDGGLVSYGLNGIEPLRRAADYVDRILKGQSKRLARSGSGQVRAGSEPQNRQGARPDDPTFAARASRRGDRMSRQARNVGSGSWSCKNVFSTAQTDRVEPLRCG